MQLKEYLKRHKISVREFAERLGVESDTVYKWKNGHRRPRDFAPIVAETGGLVTANDFYNLPAQQDLSGGIND